MSKNKKIPFCRDQVPLLRLKHYIFDEFCFIMALIGLIKAIVISNFGLMKTSIKMKLLIYKN